MNELLNTDLSTSEYIVSIGGKEWEKNGMHRIYMSIDVFNILLERIGRLQASLNGDKNKVFYDVSTGAVMRSYNGKKPKLEIQLN
tara:strand:- start:388 stop:642 length:255 start_codon:yes stop_codon:yes gene_type:complete